MDTVKVEKAQLLATIKANRDTHRQTFEEALAGWRDRVVVELDKAVADAKAGRRYQTTFDLPQPRDFTSHYDEIIGMLELHVDSTVELNQYEYRQYVNDDWGWKQDFLATNSQYTTH